MLNQNTPEERLKAALKERFGQDIDVPHNLPGVGALLAIASQVSHRRWTHAPVPPALVKLLAACGLSAPSKSYLQQADIVDVRDPVQRAAVCNLVPQMPWMLDAPALLIFCGNGQRFKDLFEQRSMPFLNDHLDGFFNPTVDASLVMMNFIHAANAVGLVCCPISMLRDQADQLTRILDLPERVFPVAGLCVGYPVQTLSVNPRLSLKATLHTDRIGQTDSAALVAEFDERYLTARSAHAAAGVNPQRWSDERARQYATPQRAHWGSYVRAQKFDLS